MTRNLLRPRPYLALLALFALAAALALAACGDDDDDGGSSGGGDTAVISAITTLDNAGFHGIDESINNDKTVPPTAQTVALKMQTVIKLTEWPDALKDKANEVQDLLGQLAAALDTDDPDLAKAGDLAHRVHESEHDLSHETWDYLYGKAGVKAGGGGADE